MNNALLYLGGLLIAALAALFAVPHFVDWNSYRGLFEQEASRALGREVRVGGAVNVRFLPVPYVGFEKVRIADTSTIGAGSIIRVDGFTMWLSVAPLLRGVLEAHQVELKRPVVQLVTDGTGGGNWTSLSFNRGSLALMPQDVTLEMVSITDGAVIVSTSDQGELARFDGINGELTAEALDGPYRFKGAVNWNGAPRTLRVSTSKADGNGDVRFKAAVDVAASRNSYVLDARVSGVKTAPKLDGEVTAKLARKNSGQPASAAPQAAIEVDEPAKPQAQPDKGPAPQKAAAEAPPVDLKAKVEGNSLGLTLKDLEISLEQGGAPQLIGGGATLKWAGKPRLDLTLSSRWLDLDRFEAATAGKPGDVVPLAAAQFYLAALAAALPAEADTTAELSFDQVTLGGEPVSAVRVLAQRAGGPLELKTVRATLPGGTDLDLSGILTPQPHPKIDGILFVTGQSFLRFLTWGLNQPDLAKDRTDGPFSLDGHFVLSDQSVDLTEATASLSGTTLKGDVKFELGERKRLALALDGTRLDAGQIRPGLIGPQFILSLLSTGGGQNGGDALAISGLDPKTMDFSLRLRTAELVDRDRILRDVDAEIAVETGMLSMPRLKFTTPEGLSVEASGEATDLPKAPRGAVRALVEAPSDAAARAFVTLLDLTDDEARQVSRLTRAVPFRLAGTMRFEGDGTRDVLIDGALQGGRVSTRLALGKGATWREAPVDLTLSLDAVDAEKIAVSLLEGLPPNAAGTGKPGSLVIKASGTPRLGLETLAQLSSEGSNLAWRGRMTIPDAGGFLAADGRIDVGMPDARLAMAAAGLPSPNGLTGVGLTGQIDAALKGGTLSLKSRDFTLGTAALKGSLTIGAASDGKVSVVADLESGTASLPTLVEALTQPSLEKTAEVPAPQPAQRWRTAQSQAQGQQLQATLWPETAFALAPFDGMTGRISARIGTLAIDPGLALSGVDLNVEVEPRGIKITKLQGKAGAGRLDASVDLSQLASGVTLSGKVSYGQAAPGSDDAANALDMTLDLKGQAMSPAALVAGLVGSGQVKVTSGSVAGLSTQGIVSVIETGVAGKGPIWGAPLQEALRAALKQGRLSLAGQTLPLTVSEGHLKLDTVKFDEPEGRSKLVAMLDLSSMRVDGEWTVEPKLQRSQGPPERAYLPPITVVYAGKLGELGELEPQITLAGLERELNLRRTEREVEQLEQIRKADQARAKAEREKREQEKAAAQAAAAAAAAAKQQSQGGPQVPAGAQTSPAPSPGAGTGAPASADPVAAPGPTTSLPIPQNSAGADNATSQADAFAPPIDGQAAAASDPAAAQAAVPIPQEAARTQRRRKPADEAWRPFQTQPY